MFTFKFSSVSFVVLMAVVILMTALSGSVDAKGLSRGGDIPIWNESTHPPRGEVRLNLMGHWSKTIPSRLQGVCYDVLEDKSKAYFIYLGLGFQSGGVKVEPTVGWSFRDNEWVGALRTYPQGDGIRGYTNLEYQIETRTYYYLAQAEVRVSPLFEWGLEAEGWSSIVNDDYYQYSNGVGINAVFHLTGLRRYRHQESKLQVEAAIQYRDLGGEWKPQAIVRFTFTPEMDAHTRERYPRGRR